MSLEGLREALRREIIPLADVKDYVRNYYLPYVKCLSYRLNSNGITLYGHAPFDLETILSLAKKFGVYGKNETPRELALTIDNINKMFQIKLLDNTLSPFLMEEFAAVQKNNLFDEINKGDTPLFFLIWNRNFEKLDFSKQSYLYQIIHGHDSTERPDLPLQSLEGNLGKAPDATVGYYKECIYRKSPSFQCNRYVKFLSQEEEGEKVAEDLLTVSL